MSGGLPPSVPVGKVDSPPAPAQRFELRFAFAISVICNQQLRGGGARLAESCEAPSGTLIGRLQDRAGGSSRLAGSEYTGSVNTGMHADVYEQCRGELVGFATRLVVRPEIAEELAQEAALRLLNAPDLPDDCVQVRAWLFAVVSNLAIDHLRRHSTWRELVLVEIRGRAERDGEFLRAAQSLRGSPELQTIAREHLTVCLSCTLRNLPPEQAAALLLKEVYGFTVSEVAGMLDASAVQVKNWLQHGRRRLEERYAASCALVAQEGVCHQCVELDGFFNGQARDPLEGTRRDVRARLNVLRDSRTSDLGMWHRRLLELCDDLLS